MVQCNAVTFGYGKKSLFKGLDLEARPGSCVGLLGLNGAGKTSLLKLVAGALFPQSGNISVFGKESRKRSPEVLSDLYFVSEDPWVPPLNAQSWLSRYGVFRPAFDHSGFLQMLEEFQVPLDKNAQKLSYGQKKKFAIAAAMNSGARLVLLDEPTNGLDIPSKTQFRKALASAASEERIFVVSTHQARDMENLMDPIVIIHEGKVLCSFPLGALIEKFTMQRLENTDKPGIIYAEKDAFGWTALCRKTDKHEEANTADLETVFSAAINEPVKFQAALEEEGL